MTLRVLQSTWNALAHPSVWLPSAIGTIGAQIAFDTVGINAGFWNLPMSSMPLLVGVLCLRFWLGLCASATALAVMRNNFRWRPTYWVPLTTAFEAGVVTLALLFPILACLLFLVVPGVIVALRWSQVALLIVDGREQWFGSVRESEDLTRGHWLSIFSVWLIAGGIVAGVAWLAQGIGEMALALQAPGLLSKAIQWTVQVGADAFGLVVLAALYHELVSCDAD